MSPENTKDGAEEMQWNHSGTMTRQVRQYHYLSKLGKEILQYHVHRLMCVADDVPVRMDALSVGDGDGDGDDDCDYHGYEPG